MLKELFLLVLVGLSSGDMEDDYENMNSTISNSNDTTPLSAGMHSTYFFFKLSY